MANQIRNTYRVFFSGVEGTTETTITAASHHEAVATIASRYGMSYNITAQLKTA